jgi:hypothetical protein
VNNSRQDDFDGGFDVGAPGKKYHHRQGTVEGMSSKPLYPLLPVLNVLIQSRYVVLGTGAHLKTQTDILSESTGKSPAHQGLQSASSKSDLVEDAPPPKEPLPPRLYISIYKAKVGTNSERLEIC